MTESLLLKVEQHIRDQIDGTLKRQTEVALSDLKDFF